MGDISARIHRMWARGKRKGFQHVSRIVRSLDAGARERMISATFTSTGLNEVQEIHSWTTKAELEALYFLARSCGEDATALEIGSYVGASTCYVAAGLRGKAARLLCVDTWQNETMPEGPRDTFAEFLQNTEPFGARVVPVRKRSDCLTDEDISSPLDLIVIDGDHAYEAVNQDFARVCQWIKPGTVVAFHDVSAIEYPGVAQVVGEAICTNLWVLEGVVETLAWLRYRGPSGGRSID